ncbi:MAG: TraB/GumN family protein [Dehalococcoidia bacterium]
MNSMKPVNPETSTSRVLSPLKILGYAIVFAFLTVLFTAACSGSGTEQPDSPDRSFLWEVTSSSSTVYILGSIHMASPDLYPLDDSIENAFNTSDYLAVEFDITTTNTGQLVRLLRDKGTYPPGESLYHNIPEELYKQTDEVLEELGSDVFLFNSFEPWVVAMGIEGLIMADYGYTEENGIDIYFLNKAHQEGKEIIEMESAEFQLELLDSLSDEMQILLLEEIVKNPPGENELERMFDVWRSGAILEMESLVLSSDEEDPELMALNEKLLDERNFLMVEKIQSFLGDTGTYFVVVGAGHLVGDNGIISLLGESGYEPGQL